MTRLAAAALMLALADAAATSLLTPAAGVRAAEPPALQNDSISIQYLPPRSDKFVQIYERLKKRQMLEELAAFLSPLDFGDNGLLLSLEEGAPSACSYPDNPNSYYDGRGTLHLCYSFFYFLENDVAKTYPRPPDEPFTARTPGLIPGFGRGEVIVGGIVTVALHELGHAASHLLNLPRFGREEDLADEFAGFLMLQFGPQVALPAIKGAYNTWHHFNALALINNKGTILPTQEANVHSLAVQRAYNFLCLGYGKDPEAFAELGETLLPRARRDNCKNEYLQAEFAFKKTILPRVNLELMKRVQAMQIFRPEDFKL